MKLLRFEAGEWKRYGVAILAGLVWAAAFPHPGVAGLAWVAPGLMLASAAGAGRGAAFRLGYAAGLAHYLTALYWILLIPVSDLPLAGRVGPIAGWLALSAYLSLHPALWVWICWRIFPVPPPRPSERAPIFERVLRASWGSRAVWAFSVAALWVSWEMIQARLWTGFSWNLLGSSQYKVLPLAQVTSITGQYGISFIIVWTSVGFACAVAVLIRRPTPRWAWTREVVGPALVATAVILWGVRVVSIPLPVRGSVSVALIQPSIPQESIWDAAKARERFQQLLALSGQALTHHPDIVVWPEAALPGLFRFEPEVSEPVLELARSNRVWIIIGADDIVWKSGPRDDRRSYDSYNSSFLLSPDGNVASTYRKRQLVIFGEYIPLARWLPFMKYLTPISGGFTSGKGPVAFALPDIGIKASVLICFEDVFAHLAREYVQSDIDFLVNVTNDGWFGESAAQWQHAASAVFRAIENGIPLVRCGNNGLTCWVDERGALRDVFGAAEGNVYKAGYQIARVPILGGSKRALTIYTRYGDWFGWSMVLWSTGVIALRGRKGPNE